MRRNLKIPRILKINWIKDLSISVVFNNGESRIVDFRKLLSDIGIDKDSPASILYNVDEFAKAELFNNTVSWNNVEQFICRKNREIRKGHGMPCPYMSCLCTQRQNLQKASAPG